MGRVYTGRKVIEVYPQLWLGSEQNAENSETPTLNVACDLYVQCGRNAVKCGLIDGPGNKLAIYHAATLMLWSMMQDGPTLVVDHGCTGRCTTIAIMYLHLIRRMGWDYWLGEINKKREVEVIPHKEHWRAFNRMNWRLLGTVTEE